MILLLIIAFIGVTLFDVPGLIKKKYWRELIVFSTLMLLAFILSLLPIIGVKVPTVAAGMEFLVKDLLRLNIYD